MHPRIALLPFAGVDQCDATFSRRLLHFRVGGLRVRLLAIKLRLNNVQRLKVGSRQQYLRQPVHCLFTLPITIPVQRPFIRAVRVSLAQFADQIIKILSFRCLRAVLQRKELFARHLWHILTSGNVDLGRGFQRKLTYRSTSQVTDFDPVAKDLPGCANLVTLLPS